MRQFTDQIGSGPVPAFPRDICEVDRGTGQTPILLWQDGTRAENPGLARCQILGTVHVLEMVGDDGEMDLLLGTGGQGPAQRADAVEAEFLVPSQGWWCDRIRVGAGHPPQVDNAARQPLYRGQSRDESFVVRRLVRPD